MTLAKKIIHSPMLRWAFLIVALAGLLWAIIKNWKSLLTALSLLPWWAAPLSFVLAVVYVLFTLLSWYVVLADLGSHLPWTSALSLFGLSQIGKYIPGGVWNIVAAAQIGRDHKIPARRSVTAMTIAVLISLLTGVGLGSVTLLTTSKTVQVPTWIILVLLVLLCVILTPPILNRLVDLCFALLKRDSPGRKMTLSGLGLATLLAILAWLVAGLQIWLLIIGFGMSPSMGNLLLSIGAYALAWVVGFIVVFVPAGTGVRESVLGLFFAGLLSTGGVLGTVLVSRIAMTFADLLFAGIAVLINVMNRRKTQR
ncbi:MAG: lysylphosphatidylglycerol synthase domain-containing protein [Bifidobacterium sp.]|jgi:uncharacterized membrane protein YbhN (UPF0104 family)